MFMTFKLQEKQKKATTNKQENKTWSKLVLREKFLFSLS